MLTAIFSVKMNIIIFSNYTLLAHFKEAISPDISHIGPWTQLEVLTYKGLLQIHYDILVVATSQILFKVIRGHQMSKSETLLIYIFLIDAILNI